MPNYAIYFWNSKPSQSHKYFVNFPTPKVILKIPALCDTLRDTASIFWLAQDKTTPTIEIDSQNCFLNKGIKITFTNSDSFQKFQWSNGSKLPYFVVNQIDSFVLYTENRCFTYYWKFEGKYCPVQPFGLPTAFSPSADQNNDIFQLEGNLSGIEIVDLSIYNRWGLLVYRSEKGKLPIWDGTYKGSPQPLGVYFYTLDYLHIPTQKKETKKGEVNLMR